MNWFGKLPGFQQTPYGLECRVLRQVPTLLAAAAAVPALMSLMARLWMDAGSAEELSRQLRLFDFMMIGLAAFGWTLIATVSLGCVIVWLMKGPAYVADAYPLPGSPDGQPGADAH